MTVNKITINGFTLEVEGDEVVIRQGVLYVNGNPVQSQLTAEVQIFWHGDLASLEVDHGSVQCRDVEGNVTANGDVSCRNVEGNVTAGSVRASGFGGSASASSASASGHIGNVSASSASASAAGIRIGHGGISCGNLNAGGRSGK